MTPRLFAYPTIPPLLTAFYPVILSRRVIYRGHSGISNQRNKDVNLCIVRGQI